MSYASLKQFHINHVCYDNIFYVTCYAQINIFIYIEHHAAAIIQKQQTEFKISTRSWPEVNSWSHCGSGHVQKATLRLQTNKEGTV